jgi:HK97 family phage major capsid protein
VLEQIAAWVATTRQALDDLVQLRDVIDNDLRLAVNEVLANQVINGNGTSPNIRGLLNFSGIQTVPFVASTSAIDMIAKGIAQIASGGYGQPTFIAMNPADFYGMVVSKISGTYALGAPTVWLPPVVADAHIPASTAIVGDARYAKIYQTSDVRFIIGSQYDDHTKNKQTIVGEVRSALWLSRPAAFAKVALA